MVEVVVGEEEVVDLRRPEAGLHEFVRRSGATIEHDLLAIDIDDVGRAEAGGSRRGGAGAEDVDGGGEFVVGHWVGQLGFARRTSVGFGEVTEHIVSGRNNSYVDLGGADGCFEIRGASRLLSSMNQ